MTSPQQSTATLLEVSAETVSDAVKSINAGGTDLEKAAKAIADEIAVPTLKELAGTYPSLKDLEFARAVDYVSTSLVAALFDGVGADEDAVVQLEDGYVAVPAVYREVLQAGAEPRPALSRASVPTFTGSRWSR